MTLGSASESVGRGRVSPLPKNHWHRESLKIIGEASSASAESQHPSAQKPPGEPVLLGCRVDALIVAYRVRLGGAIADELGERQAVADDAGSALLRVGGFAFRLKRSRKRDLLAFENDDLRGFYDARGPGGFTLELVVRADYLLSHELRNAVALVRAVASAFGEVADERLRRFDLCGDFTGFPLREDDASQRLVTTRAKVSSFFSEAKDLDEATGMLCQSAVREHRNASRKITGFGVAAGNPLSARIYDKSTELNLPGRECKQQAEHERFRRLGWDGVSPVTRVEFQCRGRALDDMRLRALDELEGKLDAVWQMSTRWLRIVDPATSARRTRCALDDRWQAVRAVRFTHSAEPIRRSRVRDGGASASHLRGALLSMLGARDALSLIGVTRDSELASESEFADRLSAKGCEEWLRRYYAGLFDSAVRILVGDEIRRSMGARAAVKRAVARHDATVGRFWSSDVRIRYGARAQLHAADHASQRTLPELPPIPDDFFEQFVPVLSDEYWADRRHRQWTRSQSPLRLRDRLERDGVPRERTVASVGLGGE